MPKNKYVSGFTLVELLVVIAILGVLASIGLSAFTSAQVRGRDTQRKSDLKQISSALELYYSDYGRYPASDSAGKILGCPIPSACIWGTGQFTDAKTVYFRVLPKDPSTGRNYYYRSVTVGTANQGFQLYAKLENSEDINCIDGDCGNHDLPSNVTCGGTTSCNFAIFSPNVTPTQN